MRHKTFFASIVRFPDRHGPIPPGSFRGRSTRFAAAMARVRRPVPFRTRKLRPCTAMVLHPRGCGRVARRRFHTIRFPPVEPPRAPGGILFFPRLHRIPSFRHSYLLIFIFIYIYIHSYSFIFIHSLPIRPSVLRGAPRRAHGDGGAQAPADTEGCAAGPACPRTGPGARRRIPSGPGTCPPDGPRRTGPYGPGGGADGQGNREGHRASSLVYIGEDGGGLSVESMFHSGILSMG